MRKQKSLKEQRKYMKKILTILTLILSSVIVLTGCNAATPAKAPEVNRKAEAVKAAKANIEGLLKGDKAQYEAYYGAGKYDDRLTSELNGASILGNTAMPGTAEEKKEFYELIQVLYAKVKVEYEEKADTTVTLRIHPVKLEQKAVQDWMLAKIKTGEITQADLGDQAKGILLIFKAIKNGELNLAEAPVVDQTLELKEVAGKLQLDEASATKVTKAMIDQNLSA